MDWSKVFFSLLHAETEQDAIKALKTAGVWDDLAAWQVLGGEENNFAIVANQQTDATGALVEKIINAIDASLMSACFAAGIDPEGDTAPSSMAEAVERFFGIKHGRLGDLGPKELTQHALAIQLVAVGPKENPCYLVIDRGEGQTPASFPDTFLSLAKSNKLRIPFVQGKFNAGGTGVLQFCGQENLQLIASRRHPKAPARLDDNSRDLWGFTLMRRLEPPENDKRRSSMYVYLAPDGQIPSFSATSINAVPGDSRKNEPAQAYGEPLEYGTVVKLYNYAWRAKSTATTDARFELEKYLHSPCLPLRITETRAYKANFYSTTVSGIWAFIDAEESKEEGRRVEDGFPASATLNLESIGPLPYRIAVFKQGVESRRVPHGVFFAVNGQVHGSLPPDFIVRKLEFEYLRGHLLVSIDCTRMRNRIREDFFMASRDRIRRNDVYDEIISTLETDLKNHPGLKALNAARRARALEQALEDQEDVVSTFHELLKLDPTLRALFNPGDRLLTKIGPTEPVKFEGKRFPTYFRLAGNPKEAVIKSCPINRTCRAEFETDASNDYFDRSDSPGEITIKPLTALEYNHLWNGSYNTRFRVPSGHKPGDEITVAVSVTDPDRASKGRPSFESGFQLVVGQPDHRPSKPGGKKGPQGPDDGQKEAPGLAMPNVIEVRQKDWTKHEPAFTALDALRVKRDGEGGFDLLVNLDNQYLLNELRRPGSADEKLVIYQFKWGLALCALGLLQHDRKGSGNGAKPDATLGEPSEDLISMINRSMSGVSAVIVPIIRNLYRGPAGA